MSRATWGHGNGLSMDSRLCIDREHYNGLDAEGREEDSVAVTLEIRAEDNARIDLTDAEARKLAGFLAAWLLFRDEERGG